jgi:hypothetical protein
VTVLNWSLATGVVLGEFPALKAYYLRTLKRPSVARAIVEERAMWLAGHPDVRLPDPASL